jgi:light-regulated signal transduction histidine kinase (bacteriophytochrome)
MDTTIFHFLAWETVVLMQRCSYKTKKTENMLSTQADIFGITFRLHGTNYDGAGIGLATCECIVRNHRGTIGVESALGKGSRFYFTLVTADRSY